MNSISTYIQEVINRIDPSIFFCRHDLNELTENTVFSSFPAVVLESSDFAITGNADAFMKSRNVAFVVAISCDVNNPESIDYAEEKLELIGDTIVNNIIADKAKRIAPICNLDMNSIQGLHFKNSAMGVAFCRYTLNYSNTYNNDNISISE